MYMIRSISKIGIICNTIKTWVHCRGRIGGYRFLRLKGRVKVEVSGKNGRMVVEGRLDLVGGTINPLSKGAISHLRIGDEAVLKIGRNVRMSSVSIWVKNRISIGDFVTIGANCSILDSNMHELDYLRRREESLEFAPESSPVVICDDVFIGMNCIILKGVTIGKRAIISANSVVHKNVPEGAMWIGTNYKIL